MATRTLTNLSDEAIRQLAAARDGAARLGLTVKQFRVYALRAEGKTVTQVAVLMNMQPNRVCECTKRARQRCPGLPPLPSIRLRRRSDRPAARPLARRGRRG